MVDALAKEVEKEKMKVRFRDGRHCLYFYARCKYTSLLGDIHFKAHLNFFNFLHFRLKEVSQYYSSWNELHQQHRDCIFNKLYVKCIVVKSLY